MIHKLLRERWSEVVSFRFQKLCIKWAYIGIDGSHNHRSNHHDPIRKGNIDLPVELLRGMNDFDLRKVGKFHDLRQKLVRRCQQRICLISSQSYLK